MQPVNSAAERYDGATMFFHWVTAVLVITQLVGALTIDLFPSGWMRVYARSTHITLGASLALLLVARVAWRATRGRRLPSADKGALNIVAKATHWTLYGLLAALALAGLLLTWTRGDNVFNLFRIPAFDPTDKSLSHLVQEVHGAIAWAVLALAGVHASAAVIHRCWWHDGVLARMLPGHAPQLTPPLAVPTPR